MGPVRGECLTPARSTRSLTSAGVSAAKSRKAYSGIIAQGCDGFQRGVVSCRLRATAVEPAKRSCLRLGGWHRRAPESVGSGRQSLGSGRRWPRWGINIGSCSIEIRRRGRPWHCGPASIARRRHLTAEVQVWSYEAGAAFVLRSAVSH